MTGYRPLRSAVSTLVVVALAMAEFSILCATHHSALDGVAGPHHAAHAESSVHAGDMGGHAPPATMASEGNTDGEHHPDGPPGAPDCMDMTACVAPALGVAPPLQLRALATAARLTPTRVESTGSILFREWKRPPKSL